MKLLQALLTLTCLAGLAISEPTPSPINLDLYPFTTRGVVVSSPSALIETSHYDVSSRIDKHRKQNNDKSHHQQRVISSQQNAPLNVEATGRQQQVTKQQIYGDDEHVVSSSRAKKLAGWLKGLLFFNGQQFPFEVEQDGEQQVHDVDLMQFDMSQYEDEVVLRFNWTSSKEREAFYSAAQTLVLDIWNLQESFGDVRIHRKRVNDFLKLLPKSIRKNREEYIGDLERAVISTLPLTSTGQESGDFFNDYRQLDDIYGWLDMIQDQYPNFVTVDSIGKTYEGRDIKVIKVAHPYQHMNSSPRKVLVTSGAEGREWITIATTLYSIQRLSSSREISDNTEYYFIPVMNPDGYEYTWTHDRLWCKNRQLTSVSMCSGLSIDHSFASSWNSAETNPCSEIYAGKFEMEALEAASITKFINQSTWSGYIDFGLYNQQIISSCTLDEQEENEMVTKFSRSVSILTSRDYQDACLSNHDRGGSLLEYMNSKHEDCLAYGVRIPDFGSQGVLIPKRYVPLIGEECFGILNEFTRTI